MTHRVHRSAQRNSAGVAECMTSCGVLSNGTLEAEGRGVAKIARDHVRETGHSVHVEEHYDVFYDDDCPSTSDVPHPPRWAERRAEP